MGRPLKDGLDYFPLDTKNDDKLDLMEAKHGIVGYGVIIKLWSHIYKEFGYYYPWGEREQLLFSHRINVDINQVNAIIEYAIKIGIFDKSKAKMGVLTSRGIQKRYVEASKRRHEITFYSNLLLVNVDIIPVNVSNKPRSLLFNVYSGTHIEIEIEIEIENEIENETKKKVKTTLPAVAGEAIKPSIVSKAKQVASPLYSAIRDSFLSKTPTFSNYQKEAQAIHRIEAFSGRYNQDNPVDTARELIGKYYELTESSDKFWHKQPFTPSGMASLLDRISREVEIARPPSQEDYSMAMDIPF
jgi:hypothetical protein